MPLDATISGTASDTYATLAEAQAYAGDQGTDAAAAWLAADTKQEGTLRQAARILDTMTWKGLRVYMTQSMQWPRAWVVDKDGYPVLPTVIPPQIKNAQCELAIRLLGSDRADEDTRLTMHEKVGAIEVEYASGGRPRVVPGFVLTLCAQFLQGGAGTVVVERS